jgi:hypothetical protein
MQTQPTPKTPKLVVSKNAIIALSSLQIVGAILAFIIQVIVSINLLISWVLNAYKVHLKGDVFTHRNATHRFVTAKINFENF